MMSNRIISRLMMGTAIVAASSFLPVVSAGAADFTLPTGGSVVGGSATVTTPLVGTMNINQSTNRAVINWDSFNIGTDAHVQFFQPSSSSLAVNRVQSAGSDPTRILGRLSANGTVMVLDRNGVLFGNTATVDVGGLLASAGDVSTASVMAGDSVLTLQDFGTGAIENQGSISAADTGLVALVGPNVRNSGVINVKQGKIALAAGNETATVDLYGDGLVELAYTDKNDNLLSENTGTLRAESGNIHMTAAAVKDVVDSVVNLNGVVNANSATLVNGKIVLGAKTVNIAHGATVQGDTTVKGATANVDATISGSVTGDVGTVNVLSNAAKIQQGLDMVSTGGTVNAAAGVYDEDLVVSKNGVKLFGAFHGIAGNDASRGGLGETVVTPHSPGIQVTGDGVTVDGFIVTGASNGIEVLSADNVTISHNIVGSSTDNGIYVVGSTGSTVSDNLVDGSKFDGIFVKDSDQIMVARNRIDNSGAPVIPNERGNGILFNNVTNSRISDNHVTHALWDGIKAVFSNNLKVDTNNVHDVTRAGVSVENSVNAVIDDNLLDNLGMVGVWSEKNQFAAITNNTIGSAGTYYGIYHNYGDDSMILGNTIGSSGIYGVHVMNSAGVQVLYNAIDNTGSDGIFVKDSNHITVTGNSVRHSGVLGIPAEKGSGILISNAANSVVTGNDVSDSLWDGIKVVFSDDVNVSFNNVRRVTRSGVSVEDSARAVVEGNLLYDLGMVGIWSEDNIGARIVSNYIDHAGSFFGIFHNRGDHSVISSNTMTSAGIYGLYLRNSGDMTVQSNSFSNVAQDGIFIDNPTGINSVSNNFVTNFGRDGIRIIGNAYPLDVDISGNIINNSGSFGHAGVYLDVGASGYVALRDNTISDNLDYGVLARSGIIDLTAGANIIQNTGIGLAFYGRGGFIPSGPSVFSERVMPLLFLGGSDLALVNDTIGQTRFVDQSSLFVDLGYQTFFAPGFPTQLDGMNATYTLGGSVIDPSALGFVTASEYATLQTMINDYNDTPDRGLFLFTIGSLPVAPLGAFDESDVFLPLAFSVPQSGGGTLRITGLPRVGGGQAPVLPQPGQPQTPPLNFNDITPAAGGDETGDQQQNLAQLEPAAGGAATEQPQGAPNPADAACWADANQQLGQGNQVTYSLGPDQNQLLNDVQRCGTNQ